MEELRQYLSGLAEQCSGVPGTDGPLVVILDNLHHVSSLGEIFNGVFNCNYQNWSVLMHTQTRSSVMRTYLDYIQMFIIGAFLSSQPLHHRHHEPSHVIGPQPAASPQLPVNGCWHPARAVSGALKGRLGFHVSDAQSRHTCPPSDQVGAVRQPRGAGERLPGPLPEEEADRDGDRQPDAQRGAGEDHRLDPAGLAPPQPLPGDAQLLGRHHRYRLLSFNERA